mmetsp:Transcript_44802/g.43396  ORF Transcript_44802/g.43396 Transcript_44802/m.43396 type:complete len:135 (+) Transcript_44802:165-569(+)|eukprot:CAMPEP_0170559442 /NCGR_PEP_ID=MMETSP0211-20121228/42785_1 /TAXON_ID=311385 /ORGANISM="Pseudokeronopsis sp., Strain OXSARD2" /LENGTH=134 /DNA_ID=CAMNT_0010872475 /DNA_START=90 /DNA_END=494 /DNA_ORIENTATION=-
MTNYTEEEFNAAVYWIIYLLDLGRYLYTSDVCLCNLDEPNDPGVIVEMMFAMQMGKHIIGYRTDMRTPFGHKDDKQGGLHFFCFYPCHDFILFPNEPMRSREDADKVFDKLTGEIMQLIEKRKGEFKPHMSQEA